MLFSSVAASNVAEDIAHRHSNCLEEMDAIIPIDVRLKQIDYQLVCELCRVESGSPASTFAQLAGSELPDPLVNKLQHKPAGRLISSAPAAKKLGQLRVLGGHTSPSDYTRTRLPKSGPKRHRQHSWNSSETPFPVLRITEPTQRIQRRCPPRIRQPLLLRQAEPTAVEWSTGSVRRPWPHRAQSPPRQTSGGAPPH